MVTKTFVNQVLALSETKSEKELPSEWDVIDLYNIPKHSNQINKCLCGRPIAEVFVVQDQKNGNKTNVGSGCVNVFLNIPLDVFRAVQCVVIDPDDTIPKRILKWVWDMHWITDEEFEFYNSLRGRKNLTDDEWERKEDINTKIANCADEAKYCTKGVALEVAHRTGEPEEHESQHHREATESPTVVLNDTIEEPVLERIDVEKLAPLVLVNHAYHEGWITPRQQNSYLLIYRYAQKHNLDARRQERMMLINTKINIGIYKHHSELVRAAIEREFARQERVKKAYEAAQIAAEKGNMKLYNSAAKVFYSNVRRSELPDYIYPYLQIICDNLSIQVPV